MGLDPGSLRTGFGIIDCERGNAVLVAQGCIATAGGPLADRLRIIHAKVAALIAEHRPHEIAVERVFLSKNADSALKLAVVGVGGAEKTQVQHMVKHLLAIEIRLGADAADALAVAICHANTRRLEMIA